jgi:multiple sugar transport system substrate-binding protein
MRIRSLSLALLVAIALVATIGQVSAQQFKGKTLVILTMSDEFKTNRVVEDFEAATGAKVDLQIVPNEQYMNKLKPLLKIGKNVPDIFVGEAGYVKEVVNLGMSEDLEKAPYKANVKDQYAYAAQMGRDNGGALRALTWQTTPGGLFYRRSLAKQYLGTDDPDKVAAYFSSWDKTLETGKMLASKGITLFPTAADLANVFYAGKKKPFFDKGRNWTLDPIIKDYFDVAKKVRDGGMDAKLGAWSAPWMEGMNAKPGEAKIFCYLWPTWGLFFIMNNQKNSIGDWAVTTTPTGWYWGGTWLNIYKKSPNKDLAWAFIKMLTQDKAYAEKFALRTGDFNADKTVVAKIKSEFKNEVLGGQNHYEFFARAADTIDASGVSPDDTVVNAIISGVLGDFLEGKIPSTDAAMAEIVTRVKQQFPKAKY